MARWEKLGTICIERCTFDCVPILAVVRYRWCSLLVCGHSHLWFILDVCFLGELRITYALMLTPFQFVGGIPVRHIPGRVRSDGVREHDTYNGVQRGKDPAAPLGYRRARGLRSAAASQLSWLRCHFAVLFAYERNFL